jgi:hypothetical protein
MLAANCVGFFCEDIREEVGGTHTIIGVLPDNVTVSPAPNSEAGASLFFPRMSIYVRVNLDPSQKPKSIIARASIPGMTDFQLGHMETEALEKAFADSMAKNSPVVGIIFKAMLTPVQLSKSGLATATVTIDGEDIICAMLNIQIAL